MRYLNALASVFSQWFIPFLAWSEIFSVFLVDQYSFSSNSCSRLELVKLGQLSHLPSVIPWLWALFFQGLFPWVKSLRHFSHTLALSGISVPLGRSDLGLITISSTTSNTLKCLHPTTWYYEMDEFVLGMRFDECVQVELVLEYVFELEAELKLERKYFSCSQRFKLVEKNTNTNCKC